MVLTIGTPTPDQPAGAANVDPLRLWFRFIRLHRRVSAAIAAEMKPLGLSIPQFDLLSTLTEAGGVTQQELAQRLYVTKGNVSGLVDRLVEAGLVERRRSPGDRRSHALHLTSDGRALAERAMALQERYVRETLGSLPASDLVALERLVLSWRDSARKRENGT